MSRPEVHVTARLPEEVERALGESFSLVDGVGGVQGLVTTPTYAVDGRLLDRAGPQLRVVANFGAGFDNVDLDAATERGVVVTNTPHVLTAATAELTIALLLALVRRVVEGDRLVRRGGEWGLAPTFMLGHGLAGRTLLVVGHGRIGREVARLARAFGMEVIVAGRSDDLTPLLERADAVTLHVPLTPETRHLLSVEAFERLKPGAVLVNTSRGAVVDEAALVRALDNGRLGGAALDVFEREPNIPHTLLERENVVLTPHIGSATAEAREAMGMLCVDALRAVLLEGRIPPNALNGDALARG